MRFRLKYSYDRKGRLISLENENNDKYEFRYDRRSVSRYGSSLGTTSFRKASISSITLSSSCVISKVFVEFNGKAGICSKHALSS